MGSPEGLETNLPDLTEIPLSLLEDGPPVLAVALRMLRERLDPQRESLLNSFNACL